MLKEERHRYIIERINRDSRIYVTDLSEELKVSDDTLRRDLVELENLGLLTKVHGGAVAKSDISRKVEYIHSHKTRNGCKVSSFV